MSHSRSLWLGALVAPWFAGTPFAASVIASGHYGNGVIEALRSIAGVLAIAAPFGYAGMAFLGVPFAMWLLRRGQFCLPYLVLGGFCLGGAPFALYLGASAGVAAALQVFGIMGLAGGCVGAGAGLLAGAPLRPNNSSKPTPLRGAA